MLNKQSAYLSKSQATVHLCLPEIMRRDTQRFESATRGYQTIMVFLLTAKMFSTIPVTCKLSTCTVHVYEKLLLKLGEL